MHDPRCKLRKLEETLMLVNQELLPQYHTSISMQILDVPFAWVLVDVVFWITNGAVMQMKSGQCWLHKCHPFFFLPCFLYQVRSRIHFPFFISFGKGSPISPRTLNLAVWP